MQALAAFPRYSVDRGSFRSWLFTIAHNVVVDHYLVVLETMWILEDLCSYGVINPAFIWREYQYALDFDANRPVKVEIQSAVVAAGAGLTPEELMQLGFIEGDNDIMRTIAVESGTLEEVWAPDDLLKSAAPEFDVQNELTYTSGDVRSRKKAQTPPDGWVWQYRSAGNEPLVLTIISWSYADVDSEVGATQPVEIAGTSRSPLGNTGSDAWTECVTGQQRVELVACHSG